MLAFTFPGQGSQRPGMGTSWVSHPAWSRVDQASQATGIDVARLLLEADADELTQTNNAQLATFVLSMVVHDAATALGASPELLAGHSLGEYSALVASGVLTFEDACRIVAARGSAMRESAGERKGTMYAVLGLDDDQVEVACRRADGDVWVANYNCNGQVVISGDPEALERAGAIAKELGAKRAMPIPVGGAFHTPFMASARTKLREAIAASDFSDAKVPVVANVDAMAHSTAGEWTELCSAQLCSPVRWRQSSAKLEEMGATLFVEVGPGTVLTGLAKRNVPNSTFINVSEPSDLDKLIGAMADLEQRRAAIAALDEEVIILGEQLTIPDRLVVSPTSGLFAPNEIALEPDSSLSVGDVVGQVGEIDVTTPFAGTFKKLMVIPGERLSIGQPIAWLIAEDAK